jgi:8-oxo-dGTP pyrophosphatase MutT (NUDIX family)
MICIEKPKEFDAKFEVVSCFLEHDGKILLLHRQDSKPQGNTWGVPAGKVDEGETREDALVRELEQETGNAYSACPIYFKTVFVRYGNYDFIYHIYYMQLAEKISIEINPKEHKDYCWVSPEEALKLRLIEDEDACIKMFYNIN